MERKKSFVYGSLAYEQAWARVMDKDMVVSECQTRNNDSKNVVGVK